MKKRNIRLLCIICFCIICFGTILFLLENNKKEIETYNFDLKTNDHFEGLISDEEMGDYLLSFSGNVSDFSEITFGKGQDHYNGEYLVIDNDSIKVYMANGNYIIAEYDNTLDIKEYIKINIYADLTITPQTKIEIETKGNSMTINGVTWLSRGGTIFVETDEKTKVKDCVMSYDPYGLNNNIWLFGDSYFSSQSYSRWTSYLLMYSKNCKFMLNGYSGRASDSALASLENELKYNTPDEIIWCMGMNDGDTENSVNETWKKDIEKLMEICKKNNIELVLATIPSCPVVNNDFKNQYVKESGYKYIDFAKAVGSYENIEWYDGMLEDGEQRVHPTELGAKALYYEAITICPELLK